MNVSDVKRDLQTLFAKELKNHCRRHVVFWYDEHGEFSEDVSRLQLDDVRIRQLTEHNLFATKYELETADPDSHFLIYANMAKPSPREDWLFAHLKLGMEYTTDKVTMTMRELGVTNDELRPAFQKYAKFFKSNKRKLAFQSYEAELVSGEMVDLIVLASLTKSPFHTLDEILRTLLKEESSEKNRLWEEIEKNGHIESFWKLMERHYGYHLEERTLTSLLSFFMLTYLAEQLSDVELPQDLETYISPRPMNVIVFMNQWMNHATDRKVFNKLSDQYAEQLHISKVMHELKLENYLQADAFRLFDEMVLAYLQEQLVNDVNQFAFYKDVLEERRRLHWYEQYEHEYSAIENARWLFQFMYEKDGYIQEQSLFDMFQAYSDDYYRADLFYRKFYLAYDQAEHKERLGALRDKVENVYTNWFLRELSAKWTSRLEREQHERWPIDGVVQQEQFYQSFVEPFIRSGERVYVIISDALRFEVAKELMDRLNNERKASTRMQAIQGVIPSYTELGMAALLPHKTLHYEGERVFVDGMRATSIDQREKMIQQYVEDSIAITYQELIEKKRAELRRLLAQKKLVYIYHNTIDARGDHAATEIGVFQAAEEAVEDICRLINQLINDVSISNILITADHGFLYERDRLEVKDKMISKRAEAVIALKRRFLLTESTANLEGTMTYSLSNISNQKGSPLYVTLPKGIGRFAIQGSGANYVHGGNMLQEIVIPVITFKHDRSQSSKNDVYKVEVKLMSPFRKITNQQTYLEFFQTERVEEKRQPRILKLYFVDEDGSQISNENTLIASSESAHPSERIYREKFIFKSINYDKKAPYYLILKEESKKDVYEKVPFYIDFSNEFL